MKKPLLTLSFIIAIFLIVAGLLMYDSSNILQIIPERNYKFKDGILIGKLKVHGLYQRIVKAWIFEPNKNKNGIDLSEDGSIFYIGPAMSESEVKLLYDTLQVYIENPEKFIKNICTRYKNDTINVVYDSIYYINSTNPKPEDTIKCRLLFR